MRKARRFLVWPALAIVMVACGPTIRVESGGGPTIAQARSEPASGKMRIAVARFTNKTPYLVTEGMTDMLVSALFRTGRFIVLERENLDVILQEQKLSELGVIDAETAIPSGMLEGAEFLVVGALTEFDPDYKGFKTPVGGARYSHVGLVLTTVDSRTGRVVSSVTVTGDSKDIALGTGVLKWIGAGPLASGLSMWARTPMDSAIRLCLDKAVDHIVRYSLKKRPQR